MSVRVLIPEALCSRVRQRAHEWDMTFTETCAALINRGLTVNVQDAPTDELDTEWKIPPERRIHVGV